MEVKLGELVTGDSCKDAIHIAVVPIVAAEPLRVGDRVGVNSKGEASYSQPHIGIVDPFLNTSIVHMGKKFWLCLFPNTVTGLRHEWSHPAFDKAMGKQDSIRWLSDFAESCGESYEEIIAVADYSSYLNESIDVPPEFWVHYEIATGRKGDGRSYFSCSC